MTRTPGTVRDIRTGLAIGKTRDLTETLIDQIVALKHAQRKFYVVAGNCRMHESRQAIELLRLHDVTTLRDRQFPPDSLWLFEGEPEELGFAS